VVAVLNSAISLYYYARVVVAMYMAPPEDVERARLRGGLATAVGVSLAFTLVIGVYPQPFIRFASTRSSRSRGGEGADRKASCVRLTGLVQYGAREKGTGLAAVRWSA